MTIIYTEGADDDHHTRSVMWTHCGQITCSVDHMLKVQSEYCNAVLAAQYHSWLPRRNNQALSECVGLRQYLRHCHLSQQRTLPQ